VASAVGFVWERAGLALARELVLDAGLSAASEVVPAARLVEAEEALRTGTVWAETAQGVGRFHICRRIGRSLRVVDRITCRTLPMQVPEHPQVCLGRLLALEFSTLELHGDSPKTTVNIRSVRNTSRASLMGLRPPSPSPLTTCRQSFESPLWFARALAAAHPQNGSRWNPRRMREL
jgi:hypothetical protein